MSRIEETFARLKTKNKKAFISFIMSGDPNFQTSLDIVSKLPKVGVDIIELGIPFTDPMADGPAIQRAGQRALNSGMTLQKVLDMVAEFRKNDSATPIILMGYFNPILAFGINNFIDKCKSVGVDGLIVVDLPPEEDSELCIPAMKNGLDFIRLATPTSNKQRLELIVKNTTGFIYYVSLTGITGAEISHEASVHQQIKEIKKLTSTPVCIGFGIKTPQTVKEFSEVADGVVVGSAIVEKIEDNESVDEIISFCGELANATTLNA
tara:strand:- start:100 stop:894 length:795 start_codon:yes stop_codon:yes gene_type:complete